MFQFLKHRSEDKEIMDDLNFSDPVVFQTLRELDTINQYLGGNQVTFSGIEKLLQKSPPQALSIADLGCGSGDILRRIANWDRLKGTQLQLEGIDANPHITEYAQKHCHECQNITFKAWDIFDDRFSKQSYDIILATLFFHHFSDEELISCFSNLKNQARTGIVINDIHRHWAAYYSIKGLTQLFSKSSMVKYDAPLSVARAFRREELVQILMASGIENYLLSWQWAFRWQLVIYTD